MLDSNILKNACDFIFRILDSNVIIENELLAERTVVLTVYTPMAELTQKKFVFFS